MPFFEGNTREVDVNIFETIGLAYTILATTVFTLELIYCTFKGINTMRHFIQRGQGTDERRKETGKKVQRSTNSNHLIKLQS